MKKAVKLLFSMKKGKEAKVDKTVQLHMLKNEQCLLPSRGALTPPSIYFFHDYCCNNIKKNPFASLALIKLYTNRASANIVNNLQVVTSSEGIEELRLYTVWDMPTNLNEVLPAEPDLIPTNAVHAANMYIVLPICLKPAAKLKHYLSCEERLDELLMSYVPTNKSLPSEQLTLNRITSVLSHYGIFVCISDYEHAFISGKSIDENSHQHYGIYNRNLIQFKFDTFLTALQDHDLSLQKINVENLDYMPIGSNFVNDRNTISTCYGNIKSKIVKLPGTYEENFKNYNALTEFVVAYLMLSTLHRPSTEPFGTLKHFDLHSGLVNIVDKGPNSFRVIPLNNAALALVISYISFLRFFSSQFRHIYPDISNNVNLILGKDAPLFQVLSFKLRRFRPFEPNFLEKYQSTEVIKNNFARHYISSFLVKEGASRDEVKTFLGHISSATRSVHFTSLDINLLRTIVAQVEIHINLSVSDGGLGIQIPEQLK